MSEMRGRKCNNKKFRASRVKLPMPRTPEDHTAVKQGTWNWFKRGGGK